jgi:hypothetical protein
MSGPDPAHPAPLTPRPRLFYALLALFAVWIVAVWAMWWRL